MIVVSEATITASYTIQEYSFGVSTIWITL